MKKKERTISIIIPIYNMDKYLEESLKSVFEQTLQNFEVICIDDGSTDNSAHILKEWQKKQSNLNVYTQENKGVGFSRNLGIEKAEGEYLAFMDPDDFYPDKYVLEKLYNAAINNHVNICGGKYSQYSGNKIVIEDEKLNSNKAVFCDKKIKYTDFQEVYCFSCYIYKREMIINKHIFFPQYTRFQDPPFVLNAMLHACEFFAISDVVYRHRVGIKPIAFSLSKTTDMLKGIRDILQISSDKMLKKLHCNMVKELKEESSYRIYQYANSNSLDLENVISEINDSILQEYLKEEEGLSGYFIDMNKVKKEALLGKEEGKILLNECEKYLEVIIYGAGAFGLQLKDFLLENGINNITAFACSDEYYNFQKLNETSVVKISSLSSKRDKTLILVAMMNRYHEEIRNTLSKLAFPNVKFIDCYRIYMY